MPVRDTSSSPFVSLPMEKRDRRDCFAPEGGLVSRRFGKSPWRSPHHIITDAIFESNPKPRAFEARGFFVGAMDPMDSENTALDKSGDPSSGPVRPESLFRHADFMKLWTGETISEFGSKVGGVAISFLAL